MKTIVEYAQGLVYSLDRAVRKCGAARLKHCVVDLRQCNEMLSVRP
jgi:hypothetical protein